MLLALVTGQRCQTLRLLNLDNMTKHCDRVVFVINKLVKQSRPGIHVQPIELMTLHEEKELCVVTCLNVYLVKTATLRGDNSQLLVSYQKPHGPVACDTM